MADRPRRAGLSPNLAAVLALVVLAAALLLWQRPWQGDAEPTDGIALPTDAAAVLTQQAQALTGADNEDDFVAAMGRGDAARGFARDVWSARSAVHAGDVTWRYVAGGQIAAYDDGDARATFDIGWGGDGQWAAAGTAKVDLRVEPRADGGLDVVGVVAATDALPVWLSGKLDVKRSGDVTVIRIDGGDDHYDIEKMAGIARRNVVQVLGSNRSKADGRLVVLSAPTEQVAADLLGYQASDVRQVAAVATARDGRDGDLPDRLVVLNPAVFATMDQRAAQIVLTHEATHVMTGGIGSSAETWVVEGFADFVALHDDTASLSVSAGQILRDVSRSGPPEDLPTSEDFDTAAHGLGAVYESAWLAFHMLGEEHGDAAVIAFYRDVISGTSVDQATHDAFGLSLDQVTRQWREYLTAKAASVG